MKLSFMFYFVIFFSSVFSEEKISLENQIGQLFLAPVFEKELTEHGREYLLKTRLGNVIYFGYINGLMNREQISLLSDDLREVISKITGILPLIAIDQEGVGFNQLREGFTDFSKENCNFNKESLFLMGKTIGKELLSVGITVCLAPVVDVVLNSKSPLFYRSFGSDPKHVTECAQGMLFGLHEQGVHAVLKHFPGLGNTFVDSHTGLPVLDKTFDEIDGFELFPYYALCAEADAIMVGHLMMPCIDLDYPSSLSSIFMEEILRSRIGFQGVVITDSLVMKGVLGNIKTFEEAVNRLSEVAIRAFIAGADLMILSKMEWAEFEPTQQQSEELIVRVIENFTQAVKLGRIEKKRLEASFNRILKMKSLRNANVRK